MMRVATCCYITDTPEIAFVYVESRKMTKRMLESRSAVSLLHTKTYGKHNLTGVFLLQTPLFASSMYLKDPSIIPRSIGKSLHAI